MIRSWLTLLLALSITGTSAHATSTVACGMTIESTCGANPQDFVFFAQRGEALSFSVIPIEGPPSFAPRWRIIDVEGRPVWLTNGDRGCKGRCETTPMPSSGGFKIRVGDAGEGSGTFVLSMEAISATANGLSNGPPAPTCARTVDGQADGTRPLLDGESLAGTIERIGETDTFTLLAAPGEVVTIAVTADQPAPAFVPAYAVFDGAGARISNADCMSGACAVGPLPQATTVTILVADDGDDATGPYRIQASRTLPTTTTGATTTSTAASSTTGAPTTSTVTSTTVRETTSTSTPTQGSTTTTLVPVFDSGHALAPPVFGGEDRLGRVLVAGGERLLIGNPHWDHGRGSERVPETGQVLVVHVGSSGRFGEVVTRLEKPGPLQVGAAFGGAVAAVGAGALVGAPGARAAYLFPALDSDPVALSAGESDTTSGFGAAVAASADVLWVGAPDATAAGAAGAGRVYAFERTAAVRYVLNAPDPGVGARFGASLLASDAWLLVGAPGDAARGGEAFLHDAATGTLLQRFVSPDTRPGDGFGTALGFDGGDVLIGVPGGDDGKGRIERFDVATGSRRQVYAPADDRARGFGSAWVIRGTTLAVGAPGSQGDLGAEGVVYVLDLVTGAPVGEPLRRTTPAPGDDFGASLVAVADLLFVAVPGDDGAATDGGAVYGYRDRDLVAALRAPGPGAGFGAAIARGDGTVVIGAPEAANGAGAAVVVDPALTTVIRNVDSPASVPSGFGTAVAGLGSTTIVGAPLATVDGRDAAGVVHLFAPSSPDPRTIASPEPEAGDQFGFAVGTVGRDVLIGAPSAGVNDAGVVYRLDPRSGALQASYQAPLQNAAAFFGAAVAGDDREVLVGAPQDASGGDPVGVVHLFDAETGALVRSIANPDRAPDLFGASVALGAWVVVGAPLAYVGDVDAGAAWVIDRATGAALFRLTSPRPTAGEGFGTAVAIVGEHVVVGAPFADDGSADTGAAYVFDLATGHWGQTLRNPLQGLQDRFGAAVSPGAGSVLVGSPGASRVWGFGAAGEVFATAALVSRGASVGPRCGNGIVEGGEACDDGNAVDADDCRNDCSGRLCCDLDPPPDCDDRDPCTIDVFDPERGCVSRPSGDPACCTTDTDCPGGQCRPCLGCFIVQWDCCAGGAACIPSDPACQGETCFEGAYCQCAGKLDCAAEVVPVELMTPFVVACDALRLQASVVPDGTPVTRPDLLVARGHAKSARRSLRKTVRTARALTRTGQISPSCRRQVAAQVRVVKRAIPRGKALRACLR